VNGPEGIALFEHVISADAGRIHAADRRQWRFVVTMAAFVVFDIFSIVAPGLLVAAAYQSLSLALQDFAPALLLGLALAILYGVGGGYRTQSLVEPRTFMTVRLVILACAWAVALTIAFGLKRTDAFSRTWLFLWLLLSAGLIGLAGLVLPILYAKTPVIARLSNQRVVIQTRGAADLETDLPTASRSVPFSKRLVASGIDEALSLIDGEEPSGSNITLSLSAAELAPLLLGINRFRLSGIDVCLDILTRTPAPCSLGFEVSRFPPVQIIRRPLSDVDIAWKWLIDIVIASLGLLLLAPMFVVVSVLIYLEDGLPIFFRQPREGFRHKVFSVWKFRTMRARDSDIGALCQALPDDERITRIGRLLRATYLDEIPQLFNVLQGHMSLVGPRPHALQMNLGGIPVGSLVSEYATRHKLRPGMTGLAQVRGFRGPVHDLEHLRARIASDIEYIEHWGPVLDLVILLRTFKIVLSAAFRGKPGEKVG
jgi:lipopolysaccharide/colanic/teichoic acid biosynthesis glycosyltransferase